ncbi:MAG: pilus assembly protein [Acidimicrobiales bacterium]|nr:pilus assembly protein [Acidimicrobiales bacterium]
MLGKSGAGSRHETGTTLVEFALVAPLLFLLLFGVIEFGRAIATYTAVTTAAREAARFATTVGDDDVAIKPYLDCKGIREHAYAKTPLLDPGSTAINISYNGVADCTGSTEVAGVEVGNNDRIRVTVETTFRSPIPIISSIVGDLDIRSTQQRSIYPGSDA